MRYSSTRTLLCTILPLCLQPALRAQTKPRVSSSPTAASVPFVGCRSEGQAEPLEAPKRAATSLPINRSAAQALAYYGSTLDLSVLAPRGWYCLGVYGSGGDFLFVSSLAIDARKIFGPESRGFDGPVIEISDRHSDQGGDRLDKAQIIARVFPTYRTLATGLLYGYDIPASSYPFGPYPSDRLTYKGNALVEYTTPAQTEGLGTHSSLKKNSSPIEGVAILSGDPPDLILLSVRLPQESIGLAPVIVREVEREVSLPRRR
jgi:hypothetical protein